MWTTVAGSPSRVSGKDGALDIKRLLSSGGQQTATGLLVMLAIASLLASPHAATIPPCPDDPYDHFFISGNFWSSNHGGSPVTIPITNADGTPMRPCQEFYVDIVVTQAVRDPQWGTTHATVAALTATANNYNTSASATLPELIGNKGFPLPGTRGPSYLVTGLKVTADSNVSAGYPLVVSGTYHLRKRSAGYNRGGLVIEGATLIANGTVAQMTLTPTAQADTIQYFRVALKPQGTLQVQGVAENKHLVSDAILIAEVKAATDYTKTHGALLATIVTNGSGPSGGTVQQNSSKLITSTVFTNTSASVQDFYLVFRSNASQAGVFASDLTLTTT
jgi:hypothetical protein